MKKRMLALALALCLLLAVLPVTAGATEGESANVGTFDELTEAINAGKKQITLTADITATAAVTLPAGVTINGAGHTLQAKTTGVTEQGVVQTGSAYSIFEITSGNVHVKNLTIKGGSSTAVVNAGSLVMENVTVTQSGSSKAEGGGIKNTGKVLLKNCSIIRNVASFGAGILNTGSAAVLVMDGCSLSENRSLSMGGGAVELKSGSTMYVNNSAICNNTSAEIGGAFNIYGTTLYLMNSTVTGNATTTTYGAKGGGGIGNNSGNLYAVNSIITDNYYVTESKEAVPSDIGHYSAGVNDLHFCLYGTLTGEAITVDETNVAVAKDTKNVFAGYVTAGILSGSGKTTTKEYSRPILTRVSETDDRLYAPLKEGSPALTGGTSTQFTCSDTFTVSMSYGDTKTALGTLTASEAAVTTYLEGGTRANSVIGASGIGTAGGEATEYFTVWVNSADGGTVTGGTVHGDSYAKGTMVTVKAVADEGYTFTRWLANGKAVSVEATYTFAVTEDVTLTPVFTNSTPEVTYVTVTLNTSEGITGFQYRVNDAANWTPYTGAFKVESGSKVEVEALLEDNYTFASWSDGGTKNPYIMENLTADVTLTPTSTKGSAPVERCTVTVNEAEGGTVTGGSAQGDSYVKGTEVTLTATANEGYKFEGWQVDGQILSSENPYTFSVEKDITLTPVFTKYVTVTLIDTDEGITGFQYKVDDAADWTEYTEAFEVKSGSTVEVEASLKENYTFASWSDGETKNPYTMENLTADITLTPTTTPPVTVTLIDTDEGISGLWYKVNDAADWTEYTAAFEVKSGSTVKVFATLKDNYTFAGWGNGETDNLYTAESLTENLTLTPTTTYVEPPKPERPRPVRPTYTPPVEQKPEELPFDDVSKNDWFYDDVAYAYENGLMQGVRTRTFEPNAPITRSMIVTILYRMEGWPAVSGGCVFQDVAPGSYYESAISWAAAQGIVKGYDDTHFGPDDSITREQLAAILMRYAAYKNQDTDARASLNGFVDAGSISRYATDAVAWAVSGQLLAGVGGSRIAPAGNATRAQAAAILHRFLTK